MTKPPAMLNTAMTIAIAPSILVETDIASSKRRRAPRIVTAEMAFVIDMRGYATIGERVRSAGNPPETR